VGSIESKVQLTRILNDWAVGDASALERLTAIVYDELRRIASRSMAQEREGHLLQPSALVNEVFVRLLAGEPVDWTNRAHFFAHSARIMRRILIDFARSHAAQKRGYGQRPQVELSAIQDSAAVGSEPVDFVDLNAALDELGELSPRQAQVVELRYFGGLEIPEVAAVLGISEPTVVRDWRVARAWLFERLRSRNA
jgi:RNA polymerase sigma factor (TIGR02999 family)